MKEFIKKIEVRWSDLDPNFHMLHSKYYDLGAYCRMAFLVEHGLTPAVMVQYNIGPILFREECVFKREIAFGDRVSINVKLQKATEDFSRWTMTHEIWKNDDVLAAVITCDGAWLNTTLRKLAPPPDRVTHIFNEAPKAADFIFYTR